MPAYIVSAPDGRKLRIEGDSPPSEADLEDIFSKHAAPPTLGPEFKLSPQAQSTVALNAPEGAPWMAGRGPETFTEEAKALPGELFKPFAALPRSEVGPEENPLLRRIGKLELGAGGLLGTLGLLKGDKRLPEKIGAGAANVATDLLEATESPAGLSTLGAGGAVGAGAKTAAAKLASDRLAKILGLGFAAAGAPGAGEKIGTASVTHDPQDILEAAGATGMVALPALPGLLSAGRVGLPITTGDQLRLLARQAETGPINFPSQTGPSPPGFSPAGPNIRMGITDIDPSVMRNVPPEILQRAMEEAAGPTVRPAGVEPAIAALRRQFQPLEEAPGIIPRQEPVAAPGETITRPSFEGLKVEPGFQRSASDLLLEKSTALDPYSKGILKQFMADEAKEGRVYAFSPSDRLYRKPRSPLSAEEFERQRARREARGNVEAGLTMEEQPGYDIMPPVEPAAAPGPIPEGQPLSNLQKARLRKAAARGADAETIRNILRLPPDKPVSLTVQQATQGEVPLRGQTVVKPRPYFDRPSEALGLDRPSTAPTVEDVRTQRAAEQRAQNAPNQRTEPQGGVGEYPGIAQRENVRPNGPEIRQEEGPETIGGNRPNEGGAQQSQAVTDFQAALDSPEIKQGNKLSTAAGLAVKSIADLEALAKMRRRQATINAEFKKAIYDLPADQRMSMLQEFFASAPDQKAQLPREAIEVATDTGSWMESEASAQLKKLGKRPLDWKTNPEVADWLRKNADELGITLPEELKSLPVGEQSTTAKTTGGIPARETPLEVSDTSRAAFEKALKTAAPHELRAAVETGPDFTFEGSVPLEPSSGTPLSATDALINKLESLKLPNEFKPGQTKFAMGGNLPHPQEVVALGKAVWNTAIDTAIAAIKAGRNIGQAVSEALSYVKKNAKGFDEAKVRANLEHIIKAESGTGAVAASTQGRTVPAASATTRRMADSPRTNPVEMGVSGEVVRMRNLSKRGTAAPSVPKPVQEKIGQAEQSFYRQQSMDKVQQAVKAMSDPELIAVYKNSEIYTAAQLELANRHFAAGRDAEGYKVFQDLSEELTRHGQVINQAKMLQAFVPEQVVTIVNQSLKKGGYDPLTVEQANRLKALSKGRIDAQGALDAVTTEWVQNPTEANAIRAEKALNDSNRAALEEQRMVHRFQNRSMTSLLKSILQGNLLTPISLVANVFGNMNFAPFRAATRVGATAIDILDSFIRNSPRQVSVGGTKATIAGGIKGLKQVPDIMLRGQGDVVKGEVRSGLHPLRAWVNQLASTPEAPTIGGKLPLRDRVKLAIEGTLGIPAEFFLRGLGAGDIAFREGARARLINEQSNLKKVPASQRRMAQNFPELFFDPKTLKQINDETLGAIFQSHSPAIDALMSFSKNHGGLMDLAIATVAPYKLTPWNIIGEILSYNPIVALGKTALEAARGNKRAAEMNAAKAIVGSTLIYAGQWLYNKGLLAPSMDSRDEQQKARVLAGEVLPPNHINISGLKRALQGGDPTFRKGDETRDSMRAGGLAGSMFYMTANIGRDLETKPEAETAILSLLKNSTLEQARFGLNQSFLKGVTSLLDAVQDGETDTYLQSYANTVLSVPLPNTLSTLSRAQRKYKVDVKADSFDKQIANVVKTRLGFAGLDDYLPLKRGLWGEPLRETPKNRNELFYHFFDITKGQQVTGDATNLELYRLWRKTANSSVIPTPPDKVMIHANQSYPLNAVQRSRLAELVGQARRLMVDKLVINPNWAKQPDEQKVKLLEQAYNRGLEIGKNDFWLEDGAQLVQKPKRAGFNAR